MIKVNFHESQILIPAANGSTGLIKVTTPCIASRREVLHEHNVYLLSTQYCKYYYNLKLNFEKLRPAIFLMAT